jgi:HD-like signal output (HDOD) protein
VDEAWPAVRQLHEWGSEYLGKTWGLPADVTRVLAHHHQGEAIEPADKLVQAALRLADAMADEVGFGFHSEVTTQDRDEACVTLGLNDTRLRALQDRAKELAEAFTA